MFFRITCIIPSGGHGIRNSSPTGSILSPTEMSLHINRFSREYAERTRVTLIYRFLLVSISLVLCLFVLSKMGMSTIFSRYFSSEFTHKNYHWIILSSALFHEKIFDTAIIIEIIPPISDCISLIHQIVVIIYINDVSRNNVCIRRRVSRLIDHFHTSAYLNLFTFRATSFAENNSLLTSR